MNNAYYMILFIWNSREFKLIDSDKNISGWLKKEREEKN